MPSRLLQQQQCSAQREVSRATLYHPIPSQTEYSQVLSFLGSLPLSAPSMEDENVLQECHLFGHQVTAASCFAPPVLGACGVRESALLALLAKGLVFYRWPRRM